MESPLVFPTEPFTRGDLATIGATPAALRSALSDRRVRRLLQGVYVASSRPDSVDLRVQAVARVVTAGHVVCDRTAAWMHGVNVLGLFDSESAPPVEVCSLRGYRPTGRSDIRGRCRDLADSDIAQVAGIRVTTPLRTALDLGCILRRRDALAALDQFRHLFGLEEDLLATSSSRYFRRRGVIQLRELIPITDPRAESARESWTRLAILDDGLPTPELQYWVEADGVRLFRLDLAYPRQLVAIEYDGREFHHTPDQRAHDERRRAWLASNGWTVIVVRVGDFSGVRLGRWLDELRMALMSSYTNLRW